MLEPEKQIFKEKSKHKLVGFGPQLTFLELNFCFGNCSFLLGKHLRDFLV